MSAGPYETEQQARDTDAVRAIWAAFRADPGVGKMTPEILHMLSEACKAARLELGAFDCRVLAWLSGWEPETCVAIAGLIARANPHAGVTLTPGQMTAVLAALADAASYRTAEGMGACLECAHMQHVGNVAFCPEHRRDLDLAESYRALAAQLAGGGAPR